MNKLLIHKPATHTPYVQIVFFVLLSRKSICEVLFFIKYKIIIIQNEMNSEVPRYKIEGRS